MPSLLNTLNVKKVLLTCCLMLPAVALGQSFKPEPPVPVAALDAASVPLYPQYRVANKEQWERFFDQLIVRNTTQPALYPVAPMGSANGEAVIVLPGGGYQFLSMENEGLPVAKRLSEAGYSAFVLKYRTLPTREQPNDFLQDTVALFSKIGQGRLSENAAAVDDLQAALKRIKVLCPSYGCDANKPIHIIGFSAGARTVIRLLEREADLLEVASAALIYPPSLDPIATTREFPLFVAIAQDDPLFQQGGLTLPQRWLANGGSLEFHLYRSGNHGFGLRGNSPTSKTWSSNYIAWLSEVN